MAGAFVAAATFDSTEHARPTMIGRDRPVSVDWIGSIVVTASDRPHPRKNGISVRVRRSVLCLYTEVVTRT